MQAKWWEKVFNDCVNLVIKVHLLRNEEHRLISNVNGCVTNNGNNYKLTKNFPEPCPQGPLAPLIKNIGSILVPTRKKGF